MKALFERVFKLMVPREINLPNPKYFSAKTIRILIWSRIILKIYLILLGLYLIANFASLMRSIIIK
jgi:hypothetical protein